jgi:hypothetical protein
MREGRLVIEIDVAKFFFFFLFLGEIRNRSCYTFTALYIISSSYHVVSVTVVVVIVGSGVVIFGGNVFRRDIILRALWRI